MRQLLERIDVNHPAGKGMRAAASALLDIADSFSARKAAIHADGKLTTEGKQAALRAALPTYAADMQRARADIAKAKREVAMRKKAMVMPAKDPADTRGAIQDMEIRQFVRSLPVGERFGLLQTTKDPRILEAALAAPPEVVGMVGPMAEAVAKRVEENYAQIKFGAELSEVESLAAVVSNADAIAGAARGVLRSGADMDERSFTALVGPAEKAAAAPWLVGDKSKPQVCEPNDETGLASYRQPTTWEAANGVFYKDAAEWKAAHIDGDA